jgi:hypothetical protein
MRGRQVNIIGVITEQPMIVACLIALSCFLNYFSLYRYRTLVMNSTAILTFHNLRLTHRKVHFYSKKSVQVVSTILARLPYRKPIF